MKLAKIKNNEWHECKECGENLTVEGNETPKGVNVVVSCNCGYFEKEITFKELLLHADTREKCYDYQMHTFRKQDLQWVSGIKTA